MIVNTVAALIATTLLATGATGCKGKTAKGGENGPDCDTEFDKTKYQDKYVQCKACEKTHRGMGTMEKDCKSAIAAPWK